MRKPDWENELNKYLNTLNKKVFQFGKYDCCIFVADAMLAITGIDHMAEYRNKYTTLDEGNSLLQTVGKRSLYRTLTAKFGKAQKGVYGKKGDVAYHEDCCGLVIGRYAMFIGEKGQVIIPIKSVQRIFKVI